MTEQVLIRAMRKGRRGVLHYLLACPTIRESFTGYTVVITAACTVAWATSEGGLDRKTPAGARVVSESEYVSKMRG